MCVSARVDGGIRGAKRGGGRAASGEAGGRREQMILIGHGAGKDSCQIVKDRAERRPSERERRGE